MADASKIIMIEGTAPTVPASGKVALYCKSDHIYYSLGSDGVERSVVGTVGATGPEGPAGGINAYNYIAYASAEDGTGFTTTFNAVLDYIAVKSTTSPIVTPQASDFAGLWKNYKGATGADGATGLDGAAANIATDTLWDAAGDLVVGTGANAAGKLTKGSEGKVLTAGATTLSWETPTGGAVGLATSISDGDITHAPDGNSVFDALLGKVSHSLAIAENDFLVGAPTPFGTFVKKTLAETKAILDYGLFEIDIYGALMPKNTVASDPYFELDINGAVMPKAV